MFNLNEKRGDPLSLDPSPLSPGMLDADFGDNEFDLTLSVYTADGRSEARVLRNGGLLLVVTLHGSGLTVIPSSIARPDAAEALGGGGAAELRWNTLHGMEGATIRGCFSLQSGPDPAAWEFLATVTKPDGSEVALRASS